MTKTIYRCLRPLCEDTFIVMSGWEYPKVCPSCGCEDVEVYREIKSFSLNSVTNKNTT